MIKTILGSVYSAHNKLAIISIFWLKKANIYDYKKFKIVRLDLLEHMSVNHNFNIGHADNLVYFDEFYQKLSHRISM